MLLVGAFIGAVLLYGYRIIEQQSYSELDDESKNLLALFSSSLDGALAKYEYLPELISNNDYLLNALRLSNEEHIQEANQYLEAVASSSAASDVYLMNKDGLTIAASNHRLKRSFLGRNFSFRPYFQQALSGKPGKYFALGSTSLQRGFFFSHPVSVQNELIGVAVVKITLSGLVAQWADRGNQFIVTDDDGVVFLSTVDEWKFKSIREIDPRRMNEIEAGRRYVDQKIQRLNFSQISEPESSPAIVRAVLPDGRVNTYLWKTTRSSVAGWDVHALANINSIEGTLRSRFIRPL